MPFIASNGLTEAGASKTIAAGGMNVHTTIWAPPRDVPPYRKTLRFLSRRTLASSTIVRRATFHAPFTLRSKSSRQPERS